MSNDRVSRHITHIYTYIACKCGLQFDLLTLVSQFGIGAKPHVVTEVLVDVKQNGSFAMTVGTGKSNERQQNQRWVS
jgi:hypothetical protein